jgi:hypothetical protein
MKNIYKPQQITSNHSRRRILSQLLASIAVALFSILVLDTMTAHGGLGFLSMETREKGPIFGILPILLFFASFGIGYNQRTRLTSILLIVGGAMIISFWLIVPSMGWYLYFYIVLRSIYDLQIILGAIIIGLGVLRLFQEQKLDMYHRGVSN